MPLNLKKKKEKPHRTHSYMQNACDETCGKNIVKQRPKNIVKQGPKKLVKNFDQ